MQRVLSKIKYFFILVLLCIGAGILAPFIGIIEGESIPFSISVISDLTMGALILMLIFHVTPHPSETRYLFLPYISDWLKGVLWLVLFILYFTFVGSLPSVHISPWVGRIVVFMGLFSVFLVYELGSKRARMRDEAEEKDKRILEALETQERVTIKELARRFKTTELDIDVAISRLQEKGKKIWIDLKTGEITYEG